MKKLSILIVIVWSSIIANSQIYQPLSLNSDIVLGTSQSKSSVKTEMVTTYDTTVLDEGLGGWKNVVHNHKWAVQKQDYSAVKISCAVWHGELGCPNDWLKFNQICSICLRHEHIAEKREYREIKDEYEEAVNRLNKLRRNK